MYKLAKLKNGLTLITINLPELKSVTSFIGVAAGSRYENKKNNGISHFLEHMFFKGSKKYPSAEQIATLVDGIGAVNNAATGKEYTYYWIKSADKHLELSMDILSSMLKESLLKEEEIEKEKGVIIEELRMFRDNPGHYVWDLYEKLQFGDQPLGWDIGGEEETILKFKRIDFTKYISANYSPKNMTLVFVGNLPENIVSLAENYFLSLPNNSFKTFSPYKKEIQQKTRVNIFYKKTDQAHLVLGAEAFDRFNPKKYAARLIGLILGGGMSSRLFLEVREKRGLAYHVSSAHDPYLDTGTFVNYAGLKLEKLKEGIKVIKEQLEKISSEKVSEEELKKVKEMERGRMALRVESTNFLAEYFGIKFLLDKKLETFEDYLNKIDSVTPDDILNVSKEIFGKNKYNLQIIAPLKSPEKFEKILNN